MSLVNLKKFFHQNRAEVLMVVAITLLALVLRVWRIDEYLTFLGDEGRDVRIVRDILRGDPAFIGPQTSIGNMYLGPLYYYMMAPFLWLTGLNPVGPAIMVALLSTVTVAFTWWVGRTWFNKTSGLVAALLFALSPVAIIYSRSSWNPNPMPFFALLAMWGMWHIYKFENWRWLPVVGISLAFALQMHYLGLLLFPAVGLVWLLALKRGNSQMRRSGVVQTIVALLAFLLLMSPLVLFDLKHDFLNFRAFQTFFGDRQTTVNLNPGRSDRFMPVLYKITDDLVLGTSGWQIEVVAVLVLVFSLVALFKYKQQTEYRLLLLWLAFGWFGLSVYKQHVYAHYFGFIFPAIYLLLGVLFTFFWKRNILGKLGAALALMLLVLLFVLESPLNQNPNRQLSRTQQAVEEIIIESKGEEFNFGLIAKQNYDESYRYFFENFNAPLVRGEDKVTNQLFVICENGEECQPLNNPQYQVAIFGPASIEREWRIDHLRLYKLVHTPQE